MTPGVAAAQSATATIVIAFALVILVLCVVCDWLASETVTLDDDDPRGY